MTTLEIVLLALSGVETIVTCIVYKKQKKKLDAATERANNLIAEYETAIKQLNIWRNAT